MYNIQESCSCFMLGSVAMTRLKILYITKQITQEQAKHSQLYYHDMHSLTPIKYYNRYHGPINGLRV